MNANERAILQEVMAHHPGGVSLSSLGAEVKKRHGVLISGLLKKLEQAPSYFILAPLDNGGWNVHSHPEAPVRAPVASVKKATPAAAQPVNVAPGDVRGARVKRDVKDRKVRKVRDGHADPERTVQFLPVDEETTSLADRLSDMRTLSEAELTTRVARTSHLIVDDETPRPVSYGALGTLVANSQPVYFNTSDPFCVVAVGTQGAGKSHTLAVLMEDCMIHTPPKVHAVPPMSTVVFHYDKNESNFCEAVTLTSSRHGGAGVAKLIVFVSPSYYRQRSAYYKNTPNCQVLPLLFRWQDLTASFIKSLMRVKVDDNMPLYMSFVLDMLRKFQKQNQRPDFDSFEYQLANSEFSAQQQTGLKQRLSLLRSLVAESEENKEIYKEGFDVRSVFKRHANDASLVMCDLTDPLMDGVEANGVFQVVLDMFKRVETTCNKLAVFDEAHKYLQPNGKDELSETIIEIARQMRHHGISLAVSTQSPQNLPAELFDLATATFLHRFQSKMWASSLSSRLPISASDAEAFPYLDTGCPLVHSVYWSDIETNRQQIRKVQIRQRITVDGGVTKSAR